MVLKREILARRAIDDGPVGLEIVLGQIGSQNADEPRPIDALFAEAAREVAGESIIADSGGAIGFAGLRLAHDLEARDAGDANRESPIVELLIARDAAGSADAAQLDLTLGRALLLLRADGLDHAQHARAAHHVFDHFEIARLENVQRQGGARQQNGTA